jgi:hypothetical protein
LKNYFNCIYLFMFNPIISVNTVGIVFPTASIYFLLFPHNLNSESKNLQTILNRESVFRPQYTRPSCAYRL